MRNTLEIALDGGGEIALHHLHVINVILQPKIVRADFIDDGKRLLRAVEIETRNVTGVARLDQQPDAGRLELVGGKPEVGCKGVAHRLRGDSWRCDPGQAVDLLAPQGVRILDCFAYAILKFSDALRQTGDTALTLGPVTGRQVVKYLNEPILLELLGELLLRIWVRKQILDRFEASLRRCIETIQEVDLVEEHREVRGELWHGDSPVML